MFGLNKYINQLSDLKWEFEDKNKQLFEDLFLVKFEKKDKYYYIKTIEYTYVDILTGLEELDFTLTKNKKEIKIKFDKL